MESTGALIRRLRKEKGEPLRRVAAYLDIDQAILSKIERGQRRATKRQIERLADYFHYDKKEMLITWLSDKIIYEIKDEKWAEDALKAAEQQIQYLKSPKITFKQIRSAVKNELKKYPPVTSAWLFGSFARDENNYMSDLDLMIDVPEKKDFSLFDIFEIQHNLESKLKRKVDIVLKGAMKSFAWKTAKKDLKLIYDRP